MYVPVLPAMYMLEERAVASDENMMVSSKSNLKLILLFHLSSSQPRPSFWLLVVPTTLLLLFWTCVFGQVLEVSVSLLPFNDKYPLFGP